MDPLDFVRQQTAITAPPLVPEIRLHLATEVTPIWQAAEESLARDGLPPPFWAFAWAGGQALARYLLDHPETVAGREVLDFGSGSGLVAIAAAKAGAARVTAADIDPFAAAAITLNATLNGAAVMVMSDNLLDGDTRFWKLVTTGDICYEQPMAEPAMRWLRLLATGLVMLGLAQGVVGLVIAWLLLGIGMTMGLYDAAFAALTRLYGREARASITGITLLAGFASTLGWPASAWFEHAFGWREACLIWAAVNLFIAMPLNWLLIPPVPPLPASDAEKGETGHVAPPRGAMPILAFYFCTTAFVTGALQAHLLRFLGTGGLAAAMAISPGTLGGAARVGA